MGKTVLCVDDDVDIVEVTKYIIEKLNYRFLIAYSCEDSLSLLQKEIPDLILLDLQFPNMQGEEFCTLIKKDPRLNHIPVILFAAKSFDFENLLKEIGAEDFIVKPFQQQELISKIKKYLG